VNITSIFDVKETLEKITPTKLEELKLTEAK
jgi:hypothetical protein